MLKVPSMRKIKYGKSKDIQAQVVVWLSLFNLEYRYVVLLREMQHWLIDNIQSAHRFTQVRILERNL
jgi:hypothetical protein